MTNLELMRVDSIVSLLFSHFCIHFIFLALSKIFLLHVRVYLYAWRHRCFIAINTICLQQKNWFSNANKNYAKFYAMPYNEINVHSTRLQRTVVATELLWEISTEYAVSAQQWQSAGTSNSTLSLPLSRQPC